MTPTERHEAALLMHQVLEKRRAKRVRQKEVSVMTYHMESVERAKKRLRHSGVGCRYGKNINY